MNDPITQAFSVVISTVLDWPFQHLMNPEQIKRTSIVRNDFRFFGLELCYDFLKPVQGFHMAHSDGVDDVVSNPAVSPEQQANAPG